MYSVSMNEDCPGIERRILELQQSYRCTPEEINQGECDVFADEIVEEYPEATWVNNLEFAAQNGISEHVWVECGGTYYDAEVPGGVSDWRELPFFRRQVAQQSRFSKRDLRRAEVVEPEVGVPRVEAGHDVTKRS